MFDIVIDVVRVGNLLKCTFQDLLLRVSRNSTECPIDPQETSVQCGVGNADRRLFERRAEPFFALAQGLLGLLTVGDVMEGDDRAGF